jgi:hypothetical protein
MVRSVTGADASCTRLIGSGMDFGVAEWEYGYALGKNVHMK